MEAVIDHVIRFPTVIYSVPLGVCLFLWLFSLLGLFDFELVGMDLDVDADSGADLSGLLSTFGLSGVPLTLGLSLLFFFAWSLSLVGVTWLLPYFDNELYLLSSKIALLVLSFIISVFITGRITRLLSRVFVVHEAESNHALPGRHCIVNSLSVTDQFGQAKVDDGGAGLIISVRCQKGEAFNKGEEAVIYQYDAEKNIYHIAKLN